MSNGFAVEAIVAQIRSRIAHENARKSGTSSAGISANEGPAWDVVRCRQRIDEDTARFADLDLQLEYAARSIGQQPFAPPTWRGRIGAWIVQGLRRLLWWYGLPIKESIAQIGLRNREHAIRHRYLREDLLALSESLQAFTGRMEHAESRFHELQEMREDWGRRHHGAAQQIAALDDRIQELKAAHAVSESLHANLLSRVADLESRQASDTGRIRRCDEALGNLAERLADAAARAERQEQAIAALNLQLQGEARAREVLAGVVKETLASLPSRVSSLEAIRENHTGRMQQFDEALAGLGGRIADATGRAERLEQTAGNLSLQFQAEAREREILAGVVSGQASKLEQVAGAVEPLAGLPARVSSLALNQEQQRAALLLQESRVGMFLREVRLQFPEPLSKAQVQQFAETAEDPVHALYAEFEDTFRGPRNLIKERQQVYIPSLLQAQAGSGSAPVLDLGCGRGEWLELLNERNLEARGVDSNPRMIERCQALGLHATQGDALASLRALPDRSVGAITSFHMVEHMPFETVIALLDEALRVLKTGGVLILETPNPQNVLVGSCTFWIDPTHRHPIPSQTLRFFVEARGFCNAEVWNLQPYPAEIRLAEDPAGLGTRFNECFYGPQDYGIIARRP